MREGLSNAVGACSSSKAVIMDTGSMPIEQFLEFSGEGSRGKVKTS